MMRRSPITRLSLGLVMLTVSILFSGDLLFGSSHGEAAAVLEARKRLCESLATQLSILIENDNLVHLERTLKSLVRREEEVLSAGLRSVDGPLSIEVGVHARYWVDVPPGQSTPTHAQVPVFKGEQQVATVELRFTELPSPGLSDIWTNPFLRFVLFVAVAGFIGYLIFMKRTLKHLDPSAVIPGRVKTALDVLAEGVVLLDEKFEIVLANTAFAAELDESASDLLGVSLSGLDWETVDGTKQTIDFPWERVKRTAESETGVTLRLTPLNGSRRTFVVNASPVLDEGNKPHGVMVTFDDVTELEQTNEDLTRTVDELKVSRNEIRRQNESLNVLATQDPLTGCLNRRSFFERGESEITESLRDGQTVSCMMLDIDHFKSINDNYGHAVGDRVIQLFAETLRGGLRSVDLVGRYGGEEFCVLLPGLDIEKASEIAEGVRQHIETHLKSALDAGCERVITASLGWFRPEVRPRTFKSLWTRPTRPCIHPRKTGAI